MNIESIKQEISEVLSRQRWEEPCAPLPIFIQADNCKDVYDVCKSYTDMGWHILIQEQEDYFYILTFSRRFLSFSKSDLKRQTIYYSV